MTDFEVIYGIGVEVGKAPEPGGRNNLQNEELEGLVRICDGREPDFIHIVMCRFAIGEHCTVCDVVSHPGKRETS